MSKDLRKQALTFEVIMIIKLIIKEVIVVVVICVSWGDIIQTSDYEVRYFANHWSSGILYNV